MRSRKLLKVAIDSRWLGPHGIGRFAAEMQRRIEFSGVVRGGIPPSHPLDSLAMSLRLLGDRGRWIYSPGFNAPLFGLRRYILTVHDLNHIDTPAQSLLKRLYYHLVLKRACRRVARVLTVSEFSRRRIVDWAGVPEDQVVNVGNGVGAEFTRSGPRFEPGYRYFLCVSNRKPHKNEARMLRAFADAAINPAIRLLVSGEETEDLLNLIEQLGLAKRIVFMGSLDDGELAARYRGAIGLLFASLYEGFGLPIVEAMSCGTPVITSSVASMPEIAGDAALLVDPGSVRDISRAITSVAEDCGGVATRLSRLGLERAKGFDWEVVADRVFEQLARLD